ncbi:hypothetical protein SAMN05192534_109121 [Alteribacillus persepolensis]|uniref:Uncharacterized protein n=1 Tax=Alteribacillus persepolensis TaxID=568899 RepID=A0A1G8EJ94_9BACI|nr:hypothetical protein SAMN05192534_109121 [Alteribacillus persepolensis]
MTWMTGYPQLAAIPPIFVVTYEVLKVSSYDKSTAANQVVMLSISTTLGVVLYMLLDSWVVITFISMVLMFFYKR